MAIDDNVIICVPGILAHSSEQHQPLWLERVAHVEHIGYDSKDFSGEAAIGQLMDRTQKFVNQGRQVKVLGTSLGGNVAAIAVHRMLTNGVPLSEAPFRLVLADAPAGSVSFAAAKSIPPGLILSPVGKGVFAAIGGITVFMNSRGAGLPKDDLITMPNDPRVRKHMTGQSDFSEDEWHDKIKSIAKKGLSGHSGKVWSQQIRQMTEWYEQGVLDEAARSLREIDAVYVQYVRGNDVIVQPKTQQWWLERMGMNNAGGSPRWRTIQAPHCGYLQMQPESDAVLLPLLE